MIRSFLASTLVAAASLALAASPASAHFVWMKQSPAGDATKVEVFFSEDASPDDAKLLSRLEGLEVWWTPASGEREQIELKQEGAALVGTAPGKVGAFTASKVYGVNERNGETYRLIYHAQAWPSLESGAKIEIPRDARLELMLHADRLENGKLRLVALYQGKAVEGAEVSAYLPGTGPKNALTDAKGTAEFDLGTAGTCEFRVRHVVEEAGELEGEAYPATRHYATLVLDTAGKGEAHGAAGKGETNAEAAAVKLPDLPEAVTSFGAATAGDYVYVYGGNRAASHTYFVEGQDNVLRRTKLSGGGEWEALAEGPRLQGLALVSHDGKLYRLGGFNAANAKGEEHQLHSQASVGMFDPAVGQWKELPPLPEPRSSFDAAVANGAIYVVGGWNMQHGEESAWHSTAWKLDLTKGENELKWEKIADAPFQRRALAVAAHDGKIYAIGGMTSESDIIPGVDVYDPATKEWKPGPALASDERMAGFGSAAFEIGGKLYVTTADGTLQRLSDSGDAWEVVKQLDNARFFHRMVPYDDTRFIMIGGSNMEFGWKFEEVDVISVK
ncbi:MAG TPA: hypothetical protein VGN57_09600 [Pirellulaceae bacterium]|jgi:N-acetylneuraminic acid mutarotase|nr:hypothetical protein [Pirellulaceae bacterium]